MSYLGLPPIPPDLKSITPYLQRAHETSTQDPIISYWCAYYAAQVGISFKAVSTPNRRTPTRTRGVHPSLDGEASRPPLLEHALDCHNPQFGGSIVLPSGCIYALVDQWPRRPCTTQSLRLSMPYGASIHGSVIPYVEFAIICMRGLKI
ncbi:hypothetical protein BJV74DRAFT_250301 [Russula compacta]|nr:hypothetical protein BJV74DRAFT_250301 [Russula compacta]